MRQFYQAIRKPNDRIRGRKEAGSAVSSGTEGMSNRYRSSMTDRTVYVPSYTAVSS